MIALLVIILLLLVLNTTILLIHVEDKPDREIHPVAIEAVRAATPIETKTEPKPKPKYRTWSEMRAKLEADEQ